MGIEAHVCVFQSALDLIEHGYEVHLVVDGVSSKRTADRAVAIQVLTVPIFALPCMQPLKSEASSACRGCPIWGHSLCSQKWRSSSSWAPPRCTCDGPSYIYGQTLGLKPCVRTAPCFQSDQQPGQGGAPERALNAVRHHKQMFVCLRG